MGARVSLFREPDAGKLPVRFDEREQETELGQTGLRGRGESPVTSPPGDYFYCACSRLYSQFHSSTRGREGNTGLPNRYSQSSNRQSRSEANCKLILVSTTDDGSLIGVFSDPDNPFRIHKNFHAVYVLKHDELHVSSFSQSWCRFGAKITERAVILPNIVQNVWTPTHVNCRQIAISLIIRTRRCEASRNRSKFE